MKMFGLAALAAVVTMALVGTTSASATSTVLCEVLEGLECPAGKEIELEKIHLANSTLPGGPGTPEGTPTLLNSTADVLCLTVLVEAEALDLGESQVIHALKQEFSGCGTNSAHTNCTVATEELPLFHLLKIGEDEGSVLGLNGKVRVKCTIFGFLKINCVFLLENLLFTGKGPKASKTTYGDVDAKEIPKEPPIKSEGGGLCPETSSLDGLLLPLSPEYITGEPPGTVLCETLEGLICPTGKKVELEKIHLANSTLPGGPGTPEGTPTLLNSTADVLCLSVLVEAEALDLGVNEPQTIHANKLAFENCGTNSTHNNCEVKAEELPLFHLLKIGEDEGSVSALNGKVLVKCTISGFVKINCVYKLENLSFTAKGPQASKTSYGDVDAKKTEAKLVEGGGLCPTESFLDGLLSPLAPPSSGILCKSHEVPCAGGKEVSSLHVVSTEPPVLLNSVANVECEESLGEASVAATEGGKQVVTFSKLTWSECHTQGAADNCTVTTTTLPKLSFSVKALNSAAVTQTSGAVEVKCTILALMELDCVYGGELSLGFEGALAVKGRDNGVLTASKAVTKLAEAKEDCPETAKWDFSYEPLEHVYAVESKATGVGPLYITE
jgi:hypothetical protein